MNEARLYPTGVTAVTGKVSIQSPELLHIRGKEAVSYGAHQVWYSGWFQRMGGCGATAASNLLWYLAATRPEECGGLFDGDCANRTDMLRLMDEVWRYVTPGIRGVDKASMLADGAVRYGADHGIPLGFRVLEIPAVSAMRPDTEAVCTFLAAAFTDNLPVAFLNLSNGAVKNLDNWHWVTLISMDGAQRAEMYDQGRRQMIDLELWLGTTTGGGAFVTLEPSYKK